MVQLVERELSADGVSPDGYAALSLIGVRGSVRLTDFAAELGLPLTTMSDVDFYKFSVPLLGGITGVAVRLQAAGLSLLAPRVTDVVRRLESRGQVRRRPNPDDGRSFLFELTARGDREWRRGWGALQRIDVQLARDVDFEEMRNALSSLGGAFDRALTDV